MTVEDMKKQGIVFISPAKLCYYDYELHESVTILRSDEEMLEKGMKSDIRYIYITYDSMLEDLPVICVEVEKPE